MTKKGLSGKTVKNCAAVLHKALSVALKQGIIVSNPCDAAEQPKVVQREIAPLRDEDIPKFLEAIEDSPYRNSLAVCLLAGLREGELLGLPWYQVDFEKGRITVSQQLQREKKKNGAYYIADTTKSGKPRTIEPPPLCFEYLRDEKRRQAGLKPVFLPSHNGNRGRQEGSGASRRTADHAPLQTRIDAKIHPRLYGGRAQGHQLP